MFMCIYTFAGSIIGSAFGNPVGAYVLAIQSVADNFIAKPIPVRGKPHFVIYLIGA